MQNVGDGGGQCLSESWGFLRGLALLDVGKWRSGCRELSNRFCWVEIENPHCRQCGFLFGSYGWT